MKLRPASFAVSALLSVLTLVGCGKSDQASAQVESTTSWSIDFESAKKQAVEQKKDILLDFTGSDWCAYCIKLDKEIFSERIFSEGVKDKLVLVKLDFPNDKSKISAETAAQNERIWKEFEMDSVGGLPAIFLADETGKPFALTGYMPMGPQAYLDHLNELRGRKTKRDEGLKAAATLEGVEKAKRLVEVLSIMQLPQPVLLKFYPEVFEQIKTLDPGDETGFNGREEMRQRMIKLEQNLGEYVKAENYEGAYQLIEAFLKTDNVSVDAKQAVLHARGMIKATEGKFVDAIHALDEAKAVAPSSQLGMLIDKQRTELEGQNGSPVPAK